MPWTVGDVNRFKQGLTQEQKKKWVSIANSVLRECRRKNEGNCDQKAIRTANSQVTANTMETKERNIVVQSVAATDYQIRTETHQGKEHIVVPVVMMVEGVHSGSRGPLFHSAEELGRVPAAWNGIPIVIQHPQEDGMFVSANMPEQIESSVGRVYNAHMEDDKLKAEAWLDVQKLAAVSSTALDSIQNRNPLEVSVGVFTDEEPEEGQWNGETYAAVAHNHRPDHLALLPGGRGACSWDDGCGVRVNSEHNTNNLSDNKLNLNWHEMKQEEKLKIYKDLSKEKLAVVPVTNQTGLMETLQKVSEKLDSMDSELRMYFLEELYEDKVIYRVRNRESDTNTLYQQSYSIQQDGTVELAGEPREVRKNISYDVMSTNTMRRTKFNDNNGKMKVNMEVNEKVQSKVDELIANKDSKFTNCDREWLLAQSEEKLEELKPDPKPKQPETTEKTQLDANTAIEFLKDNPPKKEEVLNLLSAEDRKATELGLKLYQDKKTEMIETITSNSEAWTKEELEAMEYSFLEKISKTVQPSSDYSGMGAGSNDLNANEGEDEFLPPTGVEIK